MVTPYSAFEQIRKKCLHWVSKLGKGTNSRHNPGTCDSGSQALWEGKGIPSSRPKAQCYPEGGRGLDFSPSDPPRRGMCAQNNLETGQDGSSWSPSLWWSEMKGSCLCLHLGVQAPRYCSQKYVLCIRRPGFESASTPSKPSTRNKPHNPLCFSFPPRVVRRIK